MSELAAWVKLNICHSVIFPVLSRVPLFDSAPLLAHLRPSLTLPIIAGIFDDIAGVVCTLSTFP